MPDSAQVRSAVDAAEQAATAGDFNAAARHLHDALVLQERELGPAHPDVASTLNNLGVVCERIGDYAEAERCYRRACEIVTAAFPADHPFVETSRHNLEAFCEARALPVNVPSKLVPEPGRSACPGDAGAGPRPAPEPGGPRTEAGPAHAGAGDRRGGRGDCVGAVVQPWARRRHQHEPERRTRGQDVRADGGSRAGAGSRAARAGGRYHEEARPSGRGAVAGPHGRARRVAGGRRRGPAVPRADAGRGVDVRARVGSGLARPHVLLHADHDPA